MAKHSRKRSEVESQDRQAQLLPDHNGNRTLNGIDSENEDSRGNADLPADVCRARVTAPCTTNVDASPPSAHKVRGWEASQ